MKKYNNRNEVPEKYKWDLTEFFETEKEFNDTLEAIVPKLQELSSFVGCTKDANKLYEFLSKYIESLRILMRLNGYALLVNDQELGNSTSIENLNKVIFLANLMSQNTAFFTPELMKLTHKEFEDLFNKNKKLEEFREYLNKEFRFIDHVLTENEEKIVSELVNSMDNYSDVSSTLLNSEHDYGKITLSDGTKETITTTNYRNLTRDKNENIRKKVYNSFYKRIDEYAPTNAYTLNSYVKMNISLAKIRKYSSAFDSKLFSHNMPKEVFLSLINATEENLDVLHNYYKLKKEVLNLNTLHQYDLNLDMAGSEKKYTVEEAQDLILKSLSPLKEDYLNHFKKIFDLKHIDYAQYKGKCSGAYSLSTLDTNSRILMSFNGALEDVSTIAHEGGHNVHHQYVLENNSIQYRDISSTVAEVASLTNECLLCNYIVKNSSKKEEKLAGLESIIRTIISNLYGAVREGKMELDMYNYVENNGAITKDYMNELTKKSLEKYYGKNVKIDKYSPLSWVNRSHYYMNFYLFDYALSISVATNVAKKIIDGDEEMLNNYLKFLSLGGDVWPIDAFKVLGFDLTDKSVYVNAIKYLESLIDEFKKIYFDKEMI